MNDFPRTVNLRDKMEAEEQAKREAIEASQPKPQEEARPKKKAQPKRVEKKIDKKKAKAIDQVYNDEEIESKQELQTIQYPIKRQSEPNPRRNAVIAFAVVVVLGILAWQFFLSGRVNPNPSPTVEGSGWLRVELINDEIYYGQIEDINADPLIIKNVYYNYDQLNPSSDQEPTNEAGNLRLVKRGKETHGPSGTMYIYQAQVNTIDLLAEDSKVLKAILDYEN